MSKNFHRDYADAVGHFCQSLPTELSVTAQEVDTYFRACTRCLGAAGELRRDMNELVDTEPVRKRLGKRAAGIISR